MLLLLCHVGLSISLKQENEEKLRSFLFTCKLITSSCWQSQDILKDSNNQHRPFQSVKYSLIPLNFHLTDKELTKNSGSGNVAWNSKKKKEQI